MYHRSAGEKSIILNISGNPRAETDMFSFFFPQGAVRPEKKENILAGRNSILYNVVLTKNYEKI